MLGGPGNRWQICISVSLFLLSFVASVLRTGIIENLTRALESPLLVLKQMFRIFFFLSVSTGG